MLQLFSSRKPVPCQRTWSRFLLLLLVLVLSFSFLLSTAEAAKQTEPIAEKGTTDVTTVAPNAAATAKHQTEQKEKKNANLPSPSPPVLSSADPLTADEASTNRALETTSAGPDASAKPSVDSYAVLVGGFFYLAIVALFAFFIYARHVRLRKTNKEQTIYQTVVSLFLGSRTGAQSGYVFSSGMSGNFTGAGRRAHRKAAVTGADRVSGSPQPQQHSSLSPAAVAGGGVNSSSKGGGGSGDGGVSGISRTLFSFLTGKERGRKETGKTSRPGDEAQDEHETVVTVKSALLPPGMVEKRETAGRE